MRISDSAPFGTPPQIFRREYWKKKTLNLLKCALYWWEKKNQPLGVTACHTVWINITKLVDKCVMLARRQKQ